MVIDIPTKAGKVPDLKQKDVRETANIGVQPTITNFSNAQHDHSDAANAGATDPAAHTQDTDSTLGSGAAAKDHGTAATDQIINVCYGTGAPPAASTTTEGSLFVEYAA